MWIEDRANIIKQTGYVYNIVLTATTAVSVTIPARAGVLFSAEMDFYAKIGGSGTTAAIAGSSVTDGTGSMFNPTARQFKDTDTVISLIARTAGVVTLEFV